MALSKLIAASTLAIRRIRREGMISVFRSKAAGVVRYRHQR
jgi:hypothetical protein